MGLRRGRTRGRATVTEVALIADLLIAGDYCGSAQQKKRNKAKGVQVPQ